MTAERISELMELSFVEHGDLIRVIDYVWF